MTTDRFTFFSIIKTTTSQNDTLIAILFKTLKLDTGVPEYFPQQMRTITAIAVSPDVITAEVTQSMELKGCEIK